MTTASRDQSSPILECLGHHRHDFSSALQIREAVSRIRKIANSTVNLGRAIPPPPHEVCMEPRFGRPTVANSLSTFWPVTILAWQWLAVLDR